MVVKKVINWLKNNWKKILIFILLIILGFLFHGFVLLFGSVVYFSWFSAFIFLIFSFSIFKAFYKKFLYFVIFLILIQTLIYFISFPKCDSSFILQVYGCECLGFKKEIGDLLGNDSECIGKIKKCYSYNFSSEYLPHREKTEVSCVGFPENL